MMEMSFLFIRMFSAILTRDIFCMFSANLTASINIYAKQLST